MNDGTPLKTLIVEDVEDDALLLVNALRRSGFAPEYRRVDNYDDLIRSLDEHWDIVFSDYTMPGFNGKDALEIVRHRNSDLPFIFVSGTIGEDRAVEAVKSGAQDYIIKGHYKRLPIAVNHALKEARMRREHRLAQEKIDQLINIDMLTGTASRSYFLETLVASLQRMRDGGGKLALFLINIDNFRGINDGMGMKGGDALIIELAGRLESAVSPDDLVARLYADQFAVLVPDLDTVAVPRIVDALTACFARPFAVNRYRKQVTGSLGYCIFPDDGDDPQVLITNATLAQVRAKRIQGSAAIRYSVDERHEFEKRVFLEMELERGIQRGEFILHYQPQVDMQTGRILGAESLVRWNHPEKGFMGPVEFIPVAEETGLILPLGSEICRLACRQLAAWVNEGLPPMRIAVNISGQQFQHEGFVNSLQETLEQCAIDPAWIELEITETALLNDPELVLVAMSRLSALGFSIALDDFGTGYSSLSYLDRFPIDVLKIDRSFTANLPGDGRKAAIVHAIIAMAEKLGVRVVAEGIETAAQMAFLRDSGCDLAQGYYIQRPVEAARIRPLLMAGAVRK